MPLYRLLFDYTVAKMAFTEPKKCIKLKQNTYVFRKGTVSKYELL